MNVRRVMLFVGIVLATAVAGCSGSDSNGDDQNPAEAPAAPSTPNDSDSPDDPEPPDAPVATLSVDNVTVHEDDGPVTFVVRLAGSPAADGTKVDFLTVDGSATAGLDYVSGAGTLDFIAGATEQTVPIEIIDDSEAEGTETFSLELDNPQGAEIGGATGVATIADDEAPDACGAPDIDEGTEAGAFLWKDCPSGSWHLLVSAAEALGYTGNVTSAEPFTAVAPVSLESDDTVDTADPRRIEFSLSVTTDTDGFDFALPDDGGACFDLQSPDATPVLVGQNRTPVQAPFDLATFGACDEEPPPPEGSEPYNIVVLFTDDQRFDTLDMTIDGTDVMPNVKQRLLPIGVKFENAYTPIPLCCPARASTYSGGFLAQNTGVLDNQPPNGGTVSFHDSGNIGVHLQEAGYRTMFVGKWLNDYPNSAPYVPPGWDTFVGRAVWANGPPWNMFTYVFGSTGESSGVGEKRGTDGQYHPYFERDRIIDFIEQVPDGEPYMVFWSSTPPHLPAVADEQDRDAFSDFVYRGRGYDEDDLSDKPRWVTSPGRPIGTDEEVRAQLQSLLSLDRAFGAVLDTIAAQGELEKTVFIVTSDNGYLWGEHGVWNKKKPYEESIRVPLLVVMPGIEPRSDEHLVSAILDLGPTLYDIAGTSGPSQGTSLVPLLKDPSIVWRDELFFEHYGTKRSLIENWAALRRGQWKYVRYWYGEEELYDLEADPFELSNRAGEPALEPVQSDLAERLEEMLGLAIHPVWVDTDGKVGEPYHLTIESWGGEPPYEWVVETGSLPPGLQLNESTGEITGTPTRAGEWTFQLRVTSSALAIQAGRPQTFVSRDITIPIH